MNSLFVHAIFGEDTGDELGDFLGQIAIFVFGRFVVPDAKLRLPAEFKGEIIRVRTVEETIQALFK